jgi:hypothetical protein
MEAPSRVCGGCPEPPRLPTRPDSPHPLIAAAGAAQSCGLRGQVRVQRLEVDDRPALEP